MPEQKSGNPSPEARVVKRITLPDGFRVGIVNLDAILKEVADLKLADLSAIKSELLKRTEILNYVPSGARDDYATALLYEYQLKYEPEAIEKAAKPEVHKHTKG